MREPLFFFDISSLLLHLRNANHFTGIQRVLINLAVSVSKKVGGEKVYLGYYDRSSGRYQVVSIADVGSDIVFSATSLAAAFGVGGKRSRTIRPLSRYRTRAAKYYFHRTKLDIAAFLGNQKAFRKFSVTVREWKKIRSTQNAAVKRKKIERIYFDNIVQPGDNLIILDSSWDVEDTKDVFSAAKSLGVVVSVMIHDLIPLVTPELVPQKAPIIFHDWLVGSGEYTSKYLTNSNKSKIDLDHFLKCYNVKIPTAAVPLAQEGLGGLGIFPISPEKIKSEAFPKLSEMIDIDQHIRAAASHPYVLFVGTLEARKNVWRIALAWEKLLETYGPTIPRLVLVGRTGWSNESFDNFVLGTSSLKGWIQQIKSPSDEELDFLYRNCEFGILVSLYEGWGLPVGEALSYGKTSVVANTTSLPEVGGDLVEYCDPTSVDSIFKACANLIFDIERRAILEQKIVNTKLRSWDDVADELLEAVKA